MFRIGGLAEGYSSTWAARGGSGEKLKDPVKHQAVQTSSSTASSGQAYKRPGYMVEKANFKGPSRPEADHSAPVLSRKDQAKVPAEEAQSTDAPNHGGRSETSKEGGAESSRGSCFDPRMVHHMQTAVPPKGNPTGAAAKAGKAGAEGPQGLKGLFKALQPGLPKTDKESGECLLPVLWLGQAAEMTLFLSLLHTDVWDIRLT